MAAAGDAVKGVTLVGFDVPDVVNSENKLRVIAAVKCHDAELAPSLVSLVVRDAGPAGTKVCSVRKYLPSDGTGVAVGLEVDFADAGEHALHVMVGEVGESGRFESVLFETTKTCRKEAAPARGPLPRLQYSDADALALCGVDVPTTVEQGRMRVIVALKRTWHDAPTQVPVFLPPPAL